MSTPDRDLVEQLRQRVALAMRGHVVALGLGNPGTDLTDALGAFEAELDDSDPADPAVRAVAQALVDGNGLTSHTELCVSRGEPSPGPGTGAALVEPAGDWVRESAQHLAQAGNGCIWTRTVWLGPWQVVDTEEGGQK